MKQVGYPSTVYVLSTLISVVDRQNRSITRLLEHWDFQDLALYYFMFIKIILILKITKKVSTVTNLRSQ